MPLDLPFAYRQSESRIPIVLLYTQEANMVEKLVIEGAQKKQVRKLFTRSRLQIWQVSHAFKRHILTWRQTRVMFPLHPVRTLTEKSIDSLASSLQSPYIFLFSFLSGGVTRPCFGKRWHW